MTDYEPTPEQVETAARAMYAERIETEDFPDEPTEWDDLPEPWRDEWREGATAALTAAGPLIAAEALRAHRRRVARFMPAGLVDRATVLADLDDYADRIEKEDA